jgi:hypothetical protein
MAPRCARYRWGSWRHDHLSLIPSTHTHTHTHMHPNSRAAVSHQMYEAFKGIGFVSIVNHGLDQRLVDGAFAQSKAFFALDAKAKASVAWTSAEANRGYLGVGKEMLCVLNFQACIALLKLVSYFSLPVFCDSRPSVFRAFFFFFFFA